MRATLFDGGFDFMFTAVPSAISIGFAVIIIIFFVMAVRGVSQWSRNNNAPLLTVEARIVAKRMSVSRHRHRHRHGDDMAMHSTTTSSAYFVTFEVESGDRMEFKVPDTEYGMLVEGDDGRLCFQGTRYKSFSRFKTNIK